MWVGWLQNELDSDNEEIQCEVDVNQVAELVDEYPKIFIYF